jgi:hypothetical protein
MRRLLPVLLLATACATTSPKRSLSDLDDIDDIDVLWEQAAPLPQADVDEDENDYQPASPASKKRHALKKGQSPAFHTSTYHLTWQGKRIGEAREVFHRSASGVRIIRHEEIRITRGGVPVDSETEVVIHADKNLRATRVELSATAGAVTRQGHAVRADDGRWVVALEGEAVRKAPRNAVPLELVPYLVAKSGKAEYQGTVLLAGYGFAITRMNLEHDGRRGRAVLKTDWGDIATELQMSGDGSLMRAATGSTGSVRVGENRLKEKFRRPELPGLSTIPVTGAGSVLLVENASRQPPPALGGQSVSLRKNGWRIHFDKKPAKVSRRISALVREVDQLLKDSHDAPGAGADDAMSLGRGDCTAHSTLLVDLAAEQNMEARLVTGFRIDGNKLVRHRWVTIKQGKSWVQVDPTFGESPVQPGKHLALAVHGDSTAQIALVDEAVFNGLASAKASWVRATVASR